MAKTKNRIKKMIFQTQNRRPLPLSTLSDEHKYIVEMYKKGRYIQDRKQLQEELIGFKQNEILSRTTGRSI
jgi:hypothetical protein